METPMPPVERATINGLDMAFWQAGPRRGVPILFCHGFPELAFSWRHQLAAVAAAGQWAIAPDQRGYGLTSRPEPVEAYDMEHLTGDLVALLDYAWACRERRCCAATTGVGRSSGRRPCVIPSEWPASSA